MQIAQNHLKFTPMLNGGQSQIGFIPFLCESFTCELYYALEKSQKIEYRKKWLHKIPFLFMQEIQAQ